MTLTSIAEMYLTMLSRSEPDPQERMYVRLAYKYGVPFGRIVTLSGIPAERVVAHLEGGD